MHQEGIKIIKESFKNVLESKTFDQELVDKYFHSNYIQFVDGNKIEFDQFLEHIKTQKKIIKEISTTFKTIIQDGNTVFSNHVVNILKTNNTSVTTHVIAEFRLKNNKIHYCDELTHMIKGDASDKNLGSITKLNNS